MRREVQARDAAHDPAASEPRAPTHVVVLSTMGGPVAPRRIIPRRPAPEQESPPATRITVVDVAAPLGPEAALTWLRGAGEEALADALAILDRALYAFRIASTDPQLPLSVDRRLATVVRLGYGAGEEVADGRWSDARELPGESSRRPRRRMLAPEGRLAAILTGRDRTLVCEELVLRARHDLDAGRERHAALQLLVALDAAISELGPGAAGRAAMTERLAELRSHRDPVADAAQAALSSPLSGGQRDAVGAALARIEAALRARVAALD